MAALFFILAALLHASLALGQAIIDTDPNAFPFCACQSKDGAYALDSVISNPANGTYCFTVRVAPPPGCDSYCCTTDLHKFEISTRSECAFPGLYLSATLTSRGETRTLSYPTITVAKRSPSGVPLGYIFKVTNLGLDLLNADGAEICVKLGANSAGQGCTTLEALCGTSSASECAYRLFNKKNDCCPGPKPPPVTPPCRDVCINFTPEGFTAPPDFTLAKCRAAAANLSALITSLATETGAIITRPFVLSEPVGCSPAANNLPVLCGAFADKTDADLLNTESGEIAHRMMDLLVGTDTLPGTYSCPLWLPFNTTVYMTLTGTESKPNVVGRRRLVDTSTDLCLVGGFATLCLSEPKVNLTCNCDNEPRSTPFAVQNGTTSGPGPRVDSTEYCFTLTTVTPNNNGYCSRSESLQKFEIEADFGLKGSLIGFHTKLGPSDGNPVFKFPSWRPFKAGGTEIYFARATGLRYTPQQAADGAQVCVILRNPTTLSDFCNDQPYCLTWLFDANKKCCPMWGTTI